MPFDPWPDEPEEPDPDPDPESRWDDPERDLPRIPSPDVDESDVDPDILETFWRSVVLANVALFGLALGPMLIYFRGQWLAGLAAVGAGAVAGLRVYQHYRAFEERHVEDGADDDARDLADARDRDVDDPGTGPPDPGDDVPDDAGDEHNA